MKLRTRLNLVLISLTAVSVGVLIVDELHDMRSSIREEIEAANRVAAHLLGSLALTDSSADGLAAVREQLQKLGHVRANDITLRTASGEVLYRAPPPVYKAGREAPAWFTRLLAPAPARQVFRIGDAELIIEAQPSRAILDAWDDLTRLVAVAVIMLLLIGGLAFWQVDRALAPFPVIVDGLERLEGGELAYRLPPLPGAEAGAIGTAFNRMAQAVEDKMEAERRRISHELHDEFAQSVTAIRSLAMAIATQSAAAAASEPARLICEEAARLYDAMHGLIPRLAPPSLDTLGLAESLESLVREWQRRHPVPVLSLQHQLPADLGGSATLAAYRVVQEGLVNVLRHAQAERVSIDLRANGQRMVVSVTDDGVGLPVEWRRPGHFGLRGLAERVEHLGGRLRVANHEPHGVSLMAEIPLVHA